MPCLQVDMGTNCFFWQIRSMRFDFTYRYSNMQTISFPAFAQIMHVFWFVLTLQLSSYSLFSLVLWQVGVLGFNGEKKFPTNAKNSPCSKSMAN